MEYVDMTGSLLSRFLQGDIYGIDQYKDDDIAVRTLINSSEYLVDMIYEIAEDKEHAQGLVKRFHNSVKFINYNLKFYIINSYILEKGVYSLDAVACYQDWLIGCMVNSALGNIQYAGISDSFQDACNALSIELKREKLFGKPKHDVNSLVLQVIRCLDDILNVNSELMMMLENDDDQRHRYLKYINDLKLSLSSNLKWGRNGFDGDFEV